MEENIIEVDAPVVSEKEKKKILKAQIRAEKKVAREEKAKKFLETFLKKPNIKPETIRKILKMAIFILAFLFVIEAIFDLPFIGTWINSLIEGQNGNFTIVCFIILLIAFLQTTPIFNIPMLPVLVIIFGSLAPSIFGIEPGFALYGTWKFWVVLLMINIGYFIGVFLVYYLGRLLGPKAYKYINDGSLDGYEKWSNMMNSNTGKIAYFLTVILPIFPDDLLIIVTGATKMKQSFVLLANLVGRFVGLLTMVTLLILYKGLGSGDGVSSFVPLIIYGILLASAITWYLINNKYLNKHKPKAEKIDICFETIEKKILKKKDVADEIIQDILNEINGKFRTKIATECELMIFGDIDYNDKDNRKNRLVIRGIFSNYWEIIFDKIYPLTEPIKTLLTDIELAREEWKNKFETSVLLKEL
jgi:membrane protein YqaA with SNARE-associated domain